MAMMLEPLSIFDSHNELIRDGVVIQFIDGNPPSSPGSKRPPVVVFGLWAGVLEGIKLHIDRDQGTGRVVGQLEW